MQVIKHKRKGFILALKCRVDFFKIFLEKKICVPKIEKCVCDLHLECKRNLKIQKNMYLSYSHMPISNFETWCGTN